MKKYVNTGHRMVVIQFEDGEAQFLRRGESISTSKKVKRLHKDIKEEEVVKNTKKVKNADK